MVFNLTSQDYKLFFGGSLLVLLVAYGAVQAGIGPMIELPIDIATALVTLAGVYFIHRATGTYGGDVGRYLAVLGLGLAYYALTFIPHVQLHIQGVQQVGPLSAMTVFMFQHTATFWVFTLAAYSFYLFWQGGRR